MIKNKGIENITVSINSGNSMLLKTDDIWNLPTSKNMFAIVNTEPTSEAGTSNMTHDMKVGRIFLAISEHRRATQRRAMGDIDIPVPPSASIINPAAMPQTAADLCESKRDTAATAPRIIFGVALRKESSLKNEHCATPSMKKVIP